MLWFFTGFYRVFITDTGYNATFIEFYRDFIILDRVFIDFHWVSLDINPFQAFVLGFTEFYRVLPSFTKFFEAFHEGIGDHLGKGNSTADLNEKKRKEIKTRENTNIFFRQ